MWTLISVSLAILLNFYSPKLPENKKSIPMKVPFTLSGQKRTIKGNIPFFGNKWV